MIIDDAKVQKAIDYLVKTDKTCAEAKSLMEFLSESRKSVKADLYLVSGGSSSAEKEQMAYADNDYKDHIQKYKDAVYQYEIQRNRRESARLIIECWRTEQANMRKGNV